MKETSEARSRIMRAVKSNDTAPEIIVRRMIHAMGYRFRLHRRDLPGKPDLAFPRLRKVIFVNGCFWHGHNCPRGARAPKTNKAYWSAKIARNRVRDAANDAKLKSAGWRAATIWECELRDLTRVQVRLAVFLRKSVG
jgi:DNA mismatch endonuclease, patch repair protein